MEPNFDILVDKILRADAENMNENRLSKILGTAALAGTLGFSPLRAASDIPDIPREDPQTMTQHGAKHLPEYNWKARGLKNNNPGNIKVGKEKWEGVVGHDGNFLKFKSMEYGIRALAKILLTYQNKYNLDTVEQIITKFAPRKDHNPTGKYIADVCEYMNVKKDQKINLSDKHILLDLINAMIHMETGRDQPDTVVLKGIQLAGA